MEEKYHMDCDDPYKILAANIAANFSLANIKRMLSEKDYLRQLIQAEVRENTDTPGVFCDCVTTELISEKQKVLYREALNNLGLFFYQQLDIVRLRNELRKFFEECGIELTPNKK